MDCWYVPTDLFSVVKHLYKYATYHLVTPATSVASESAFSIASCLFRKQRSRLTPENLSSTMFLKDKIDSEFNVWKVKLYSAQNQSYDKQPNNSVLIPIFGTVQVDPR